jgi:hypothetical protein
LKKNVFGNSGLLGFYVEWLKVKVKVKFALEQGTKAQKGSRGIALLFL